MDFTNPDAVLWYQEKLKALLDMGVDCFKTDFGERIPVRDIAYFDGSDPVKMHNYYTYLYNKAVFELLEKERGVGEAVLSPVRRRWAARSFRPTGEETAPRPTLRWRRP